MNYAASTCLEAYYTRGRIQGCIQGFCTKISELLYKVVLSTYFCYSINEICLSFFPLQLDSWKGVYGILCCQGLYPPPPPQGGYITSTPSVLTRDSPNGTYESHLLHLRRLGQYGRMYALLSSYRDLDPYCVSHFGAADSLGVKKKASTTNFIYYLCVSIGLWHYGSLVQLWHSVMIKAVACAKLAGLTEVKSKKKNSKKQKKQLGYTDIYSTNFDGPKQLFAGYVTSSVI